MKTKIIAVITLLLIILSMSVNLYKVQAYTGEIDPEGYITLPTRINISEDKIGTATISLSSEASGYTISYQKVDTTKSVFDNMQSKANELKSYATTSQQTLNGKKTNVETLSKKYTDLLEESPDSQEEIAQAKQEYDTALKDYTDYAKTVQEKIKTLQAEIYSYIPNYTSSWTETTNTTNNLKLDLKKYSGTVYIALWVKITNGTNTYYDVDIYSPNIKETTSDPETPPTQTPPEGDWTDFSKAKLTLSKEGTSDTILEISGVTPKKLSYYGLFITNNANKPNVNWNSEDKISLTYDEKTKTFKSLTNDVLAGYVEQNKDIYATIMEKNEESDKEEIVLYGKKLTRYAEPKYTDAFFATYMVDDSTQIVTTFTHGDANKRKMQIKVGKITDTAILQKIKNKDASGFAELLKYAKSNSGILNQTVNSNENDGFAIEYNTNDLEKKLPALNLKGLQNNAYYYLYVKADDENGKYITQEGLTLAKASVYTDTKDWSLFFYGSNNFKWDEFGNSGGKDNTIAGGKIPQTGSDMIIFGTATLLIVGAGIVAYRKYRKYNF